MTAPTAPVSANIAGDVIIGDHNFKVNNNYGAIIYKQSPARVRPRAATPRPPRKPRDFLGRGAELADLERRIAAGEAVVVHGPDGLGKTALLKQAANGAAAQGMLHGVVLLEGSVVAGQAPAVEDLVQQMFDALFDSEPPLKVTPEVARTYLGNSRPLVLLDNYAGPPDSLALLADLVPLGALVCSAQTAPATEALARLKLGPLPRAEAARLLAIKLGVEIDQANRGDIDSLCGLLGDAPLALVTTANTIRDRALHLSQSAAALAAMTASDPVARAYEFMRLNLTSTERGLVAIAANTPSRSVDPEWLRTAANEFPRVEEALMRLQGMELLAGRGLRLRLAPGIRALAQLGAEDRDDLLQRLSQFLLERLLIRESDFDYCAAELGNILAAIEWAIGKRAWRLALDLGRGVDPFLTLRGQWQAWRRVLEHCLAAARGKQDRAAEAWALHQLGTRAFGLGAPAAAVELLRQALSIRQALGDTAAAAYTRHNLDLILLGLPPARSGAERKTPPDPGSVADRAGLRRPGLPGG